MAVRKGKITQKIYCYNAWWDLVEVIQPNKYQDYLLLKRVVNEICEDGSNAVEMALVDVHDEPFFTNTEENRELIKKLESNDIENKLNLNWLEVVRD
jgi:hypothetical protein